MTKVPAGKGGRRVVKGGPAGRRPGDEGAPKGRLSNDFLDDLSGIVRNGMRRGSNAGTVPKGNLTPGTGPMKGEPARRDPKTGKPLRTTKSTRTAKGNAKGRDAKR